MSSGLGRVKEGLVWMMQIFKSQNKASVEWLWCLSASSVFLREGQGPPVSWSFVACLEPSEVNSLCFVMGLWCRKSQL